MSQASSHDLPQKMTQQLPSKYGSRDTFLATYNPDMQRMCANAEECFFGDHPTLAELRRDYGCNMAVMWLLPQLYDLSEYCGVKNKLQGKPLEGCAHVIATEFYYLKVSELMLFFHRFKSGRYGKFYGTVDPLVITSALREFDAERGDAIYKHDQEKPDPPPAPPSLTDEERNAIKQRIMKLLKG